MADAIRQRRKQEPARPAEVPENTARGRARDRRPRGAGGGGFRLGGPRHSETEKAAAALQRTHTVKVCCASSVVGCCNAGPSRSKAGRCYPDAQALRARGPGSRRGRSFPVSASSFRVRTGHLGLQRRVPGVAPRSLRLRRARRR